MLNLKNLKRIAILLGVMILALGAFATMGVFAAGEAAEATAASAGMGVLGIKALAAAIAIGIPAAGGAIAMGIFGGKAVEGISRQPEADGKIRTSFMLGLVFIETAIIYALLVVILIIFVL